MQESSIKLPAMLVPWHIKHFRNAAESIKTCWIAKGTFAMYRAAVKRGDTASTSVRTQGCVCSASVSIWRCCTSLLGRTAIGTERGCVWPLCLAYSSFQCSSCSCSCFCASRKRALSLLQVFVL
jgi:hypothetical protein